MFGNTLSNFAGKFSFLPYKLGEPKRLGSLVMGLVAMAAGYGIPATSNMKSGWKTALLTFGGVCIAAWVLGLFNPVTVYNSKRFGSTTTFPGQAVGQGSGISGQPAAYFGATTYTPATQFRNIGGQQISMLAQSGFAPYLPASGNLTALYNSTTTASGEVVGQTDALPGQPTGAYYGATFHPTGPAFYGSSVVGCNPLTGEGCYDVSTKRGDINIRDFGETEAVGGI